MTKMNIAATAPATTAPVRTAADYDTNQGMISGCVQRVQNMSSNDKMMVAIVTIAGRTARPGGEVTFFEQIKFFGRAAEAALSLEEGDTIIVPNAKIAQEKWVDRESGESRSKLICYGQNFVRLNGESVRAAKTAQGGLILLDAVNEFHVSGRLIKDAEVRPLEDGRQVCEYTIATYFRRRDGEEDSYLIKVEQWGENPVARCGKKGRRVTVNVLLKTTVTRSEAGARYYTKGEARHSFVAA